MPQFDDDVYLGPATAGGPLSSTGNSAPMTRGVGPLGRIYVFDVVPLTLQANGLATSQNPGSGGSFTLTAGTGVTSRIRADGTTEYVLDTPRCVTITASGANSAIYKIFGYDVYGQPMTALLTAPSSSTVASTKAFKTVYAVTNTNTTAGTSNLTVGFNDKLGLPVAVTDMTYLVRVGYNNTQADAAGTFVVADQTTPATQSTTDVRGCYTPASATDGVKRLIIVIATPAIAAGPNATRVGAFGVTQV